MTTGPEARQLALDWALEELEPLLALLVRRRSARRYRRPLPSARVRQAMTDTVPTNNYSPIRIRRRGDREEPTDDQPTHPGHHVLGPRRWPLLQPQVSATGCPQPAQGSQVTNRAGPRVIAEIDWLNLPIHPAAETLPMMGEEALVPP